MPTGDMWAAAPPPASYVPPAEPVVPRQPGWVLYALWGVELGWCLLDTVGLIAERSAAAAFTFGVLLWTLAPPLLGMRVRTSRPRLVMGLTVASPLMLGCGVPAAVTVALMNRQVSPEDGRLQPGPGR